VSEYEELGLPWSCGGFAFPSAGRVTRAVWTRIPEGKQSGTRLTEFIDRDKAEYIEKSANAFPKLVEALNSTVSLLVALSIHASMLAKGRVPSTFKPEKMRDDIEAMLAKIRDALALAEEVE